MTEIPQAPATSSAEPGAVVVPDKPALEGLEEKWAERWKADATYAFDRSQPRQFSVQFRHDVPQSDWAWGVNFRSSDFNPYYRLAEVGLDYNLADALGVFIEHKDVFGLTVQARLSNILEENNVLDRTVYAGPRNTSPVSFSENRQREIGHIVNFTVRGNF